MMQNKKKKVSKKTKTAWRKHVKINDVEEFLEEQRFEERLGKNISLISNEELFTLDTTPSTAPVIISKQQKRERLRSAPAKCFSALKSLTNVADPITKRNRVRTKEERQNGLIKKKELANRSKGIFKRKDLQTIADMKLDSKRRMSKPVKYDFTKDVWDTKDDLLPVPQLDKSVENDEWITGDTERHVLHGPGKGTKIIPRSLRQKCSIIEPVELPHPGMSYNPSYEDHQDLLRQIVDNEKKVIKQEEHLKRVTKDMFRKVTAEERDSSWVKEMSQGLPHPDVISQDPESDGEYKSVNAPTVNKQKSLKQRRKQKEQQQLEQARRNAKQEKKKVTDIHRLKYINIQLEKAQKKTKMLQEKRLKAAEYRKREAKRLGTLKFEEPDLDFQMGGDITGNLRNLKKEGNLLSDRFKSMQKRNILEPRLMQAKKKVKVKKYTKPGHKDDWKKTVARPGNFLK